ncbi:dual specificity phosphatase [Aduncisulcus paluster]|uniref:Dual specificity phosphatase n=1 Tax=Aduncisulcus paluster TaxID=2918883 RepID=A0ABQ5JZ25_9EUKA|nr:dual specificity phosphatase [Aduncisulcus paluster]
MREIERDIYMEKERAKQREEWEKQWKAKRVQRKDGSSKKLGPHMVGVKFSPPSKKGTVSFHERQVGSIGVKTQEIGAVSDTTRSTRKGTRRFSDGSPRSRTQCRSPSVRDPFPHLSPALRMVGVKFSPPSKKGTVSFHERQVGSIGVKTQEIGAVSDTTRSTRKGTRRFSDGSPRSRTQCRSPSVRDPFPHLSPALRMVGVKSDIEMHGEEQTKRRCVSSLSFGHHNDQKPPVSIAKTHVKGRFQHQYPLSFIEADFIRQSVPSVTASPAETHIAPPAHHIDGISGSPSSPFSNPSAHTTRGGERRKDTDGMIRKDGSKPTESSYSSRTYREDSSKVLSLARPDHPLFSGTFVIPEFIGSRANKRYGTDTPADNQRNEDEDEDKALEPTRKEKKEKEVDGNPSCDTLAINGDKKPRSPSSIFIPPKEEEEELDDLDDIPIHSRDSSSVEKQPVTAISVPMVREPNRSTPALSEESSCIGQESSSRVFNLTQVTSTTSIPVICEESGVVTSCLTNDEEKSSSMKDVTEDRSPDANDSSKHLNTPIGFSLPTLDLGRISSPFSPSTPERSDDRELEHLSITARGDEKSSSKFSGESIPSLLLEGLGKVGADSDGHVLEDHDHFHNNCEREAEHREEEEDERGTGLPCDMPKESPPKKVTMQLNLKDISKDVSDFQLPSLVFPLKTISPPSSETARTRYTHAYTSLGPIDDTSPRHKTHRPLSSLDHTQHKYKQRIAAMRVGGACMSLVCSRLYVGGDGVAQDENLLLSRGITHIINCCVSAVPVYFPDTFAYLKLDLADGGTEDICSILPFCFDFINDCFSCPFGSVLVHCQQGVSRSCAVCIAWLMITRNMPFNQALKCVRTVRPVASPSAAFVSQLFSFERRMRAPPSVFDLPSIFKILPQNKKMGDMKVGRTVFSPISGEHFSHRLGTLFSSEKDRLLRIIDPSVTCIVSNLKCSFILVNEEDSLGVVWSICGQIKSYYQISLPFVCVRWEDLKRCRRLLKKIVLMGKESFDKSIQKAKELFEIERAKLSSSADPHKDKEEEKEQEEGEKSPAIAMDSQVITRNQLRLVDQLEEEILSNLHSIVGEEYVWMNRFILSGTYVLSPDELKEPTDVTICKCVCMILVMYDMMKYLQPSILIGAPTIVRDIIRRYSIKSWVDIHIMYEDDVSNFIECSFEDIQDIQHWCEEVFTPLFSTNKVRCG